MNPGARFDRCEKSELAALYAVQALSPEEMFAAQAHIDSCPDCQQELENLRPVVDRFVAWPTDVLCPTAPLHARLARRIAEETGKAPLPPPNQQWSAPDWEEMIPGIDVKILATDLERHRVSMLVRLAPYASYPAHTHADVEELHLLWGDLQIEDRHLRPGDCSYAAPGERHERVYSETGCTCILITSTRDVIM